MICSKKYIWDFRGGLVVKILCFQCTHAGWVLGQETKIPHVAWPINKKDKIIYVYIYTYIIIYIYIYRERERETERDRERQTERENLS